jgi:hypothetical protein
MSVVLLLAALAILAGVVVVAVGRGGELAIFRPDLPPQRPVFATGTDVAAFRPPPAFFGYSAPATDSALAQIAQAVAERDAELARLRAQLAQLRGDPEQPLTPGPAYHDPGYHQPPFPEPRPWPGLAPDAAGAGSALPPGWPGLDDEPEPPDWAAPGGLRLDWAAPGDDREDEGDDSPGQPAPLEEQTGDEAGHDG